MKSEDIRKKFLEFFERREHAVVPSSSLVPVGDPTALFTGSGMQPIMPYLLGEKHPLGKRIMNYQRCFRAEDIEDVGDNRHTTFFEMLGNWSFGDYWKKEQLSWLLEFLVKEVGISKDKLWVTCFSGDKEFNLLPDKESVEIWKGLGIPEERIKFYGSDKNWWSRSGPPANMPAGEPGGPDSEVFYEFTEVEHDKKFGERCHPNCDCGRFLEIGNSVFMEFKKKQDGSFEKLPQRNVDFGGGLERITAAANNDPNIYNIDIFQKIISGILSSAGVIHDSSSLIPESNYPLGPVGNNIDREESVKSVRIIADHIRAITFLLADGVMPSNKKSGYVLRKLIRNAVDEGEKIDMKNSFLSYVSVAVIDYYQNVYDGLLKKKTEIQTNLDKEEKDYLQTLSFGRKKTVEYLSHKSKEARISDSVYELNGHDAFGIYSTFAVRPHLIEEIAEKMGIKKSENYEEQFRDEQKKQQELSRTASAGMFKGGLADHSEKTTRLHTAHHLLLKALQIVLGSHVKQRGSNITSERLRIDFLHNEKMTEEQKREVEKIVNEKIAEDLPVIRSEMALEEAEKLGAEHEFGQKYPERVLVYSIGPKDATPENQNFKESFSIEFCGGPHVSHTGEIGKFRIIKEEASSAGIRRIRATVD